MLCSDQLSSGSDPLSKHQNHKLMHYHCYCLLFSYSWLTFSCSDNKTTWIWYLWCYSFLTLTVNILVFQVTLVAAGATEREGLGGGHFSPSTLFFGMVIYFLFSAFGVGGAFPELCKKHFHLDKDPTSGKLIVLVWWLQFYSKGTSKLAVDKPRRRGWCKSSLHVFNHITIFLECSVACILLNFIINVQRCIIDA